MIKPVFNGRIFMNSPTIIKLAENVNLYVINCDIFKTTAIKIFIPCELNENYTYHALIPQILKRGTKKHPDQKSIEILMQDLYGANFFTSIRKYGNKQILSFNMDIIDEQYLLSNEDLLSNAVNFLNELINEPLLENDLFKHEYVLQEAFNLKQQIMSIKNDKTSYSINRLNEEMNPGADFTKCEYGSADELDSIDPHKLICVYKKIISENPIDIFIVGDIDVQKARNLFSVFNFNNKKSLATYVPVFYLPENVRYSEELMDVQQGKLNIGFRTNIIQVHQDFYKLLMFNSIFGGSLNSKLFMNVREKASLCYYCSSRVDKFNGQLIVYTGIDVLNYQKAYDIIKEQLQACISGDITDFEYDAAIKDFESSLKSINDSAASMVNYCYSNIQAGVSTTPEEYISNIKKVTKEDIIRIASSLKEDTIYFLKSSQEATTNV